ncbi:MAG: hypothetical protein WBG70_11800 [Spirulinaceae cyanobacterium]
MRQIIPLLATLTALISLQASASPLLNSPSKFLQAQTQQPNSNSDLSLLIESLRDFLQYDTYTTQSYLQVDGQSPGVEFKVYVQINTTVSSPNKFRSEIVFGQLGETPGNRYEVISNGESVWIYQPEKQIYQVTDYESFDGSTDSFLIGLSSTLFLQIPPFFRSFLNEGTDIAMIESLLGSSVPDSLSGEAVTIEEQQYAAYEFNDEGSGFNIGVVLDPVSKMLKQVNFQGVSEELNIEATEQINSRVANPPVTADTFNFVPTEEMTEVEEIKVSPI